MQRHAAACLNVRAPQNKKWEKESEKNEKKKKKKKKKKRRRKNFESFGTDAALVLLQHTEC